eukprot:scaffold516_cov270-Pinguiococcus_pyrenoidosus.AAC.3
MRVQNPTNPRMLPGPGYDLREVLVWCHISLIRSAADQCYPSLVHCLNRRFLKGTGSKYESIEVARPSVVPDHHPVHFGVVVELPQKHYIREEAARPRRMTLCSFSKPGF